MKRIIASLLLLASLLMPTTVSAQTINGDLNHNDRLDVADVTLLLNGYLTGTTEQIASSADPFMADNTPIVGTWQKSETESITFRADGTTDYKTDCTYQFKPYQGYILFYNSSGIPVLSLRVLELTNDYIAFLPLGSDVPVIYYAYRPDPVIETTRSDNGHTWVDLGLSVKWATMNVGASSPEGYGNYFAWGETTAKPTYDLQTYQYCYNAYDKLNKYNLSSSYGIADYKTTLDFNDNAARQNWGGTWRMPTFDEWKELRTQCTWTWTTRNGVNGYQVASKTNGNSIFLPASGHNDLSSPNSVGTGGRYWSSSLYINLPYQAWDLCFLSDNVYTYSHLRCYGLSVRPVRQ